MPTTGSDDPRDMGGEIAGPGGPYDEGGVVVSTENALLVEGLFVSTVDGQSELTIAAQVDGRVNRTSDRTTLLMLFGADGLAGFVTELLALVERMKAKDPEAGEEVRRLIDERLEAMQ